MLSNAQLDKSFWVEALEYASNIMNRLLSTTIGGKTLLDIWSDEAAQDYDLLRVFECPTYFSIKDDNLNPRVKKVCVFECQEKYERLQAMGPRKQ